MKKKVKEAPTVFEDLRYLLATFKGSRERLAFMMGVSVRTIERWAKEESKPSQTELKRLHRLVGRYATGQIPVLKSLKGVTK